MSGHLGEFEKLLLFALLALDDDADGAALRRRIEDRTDRATSPGAVYTAMDRLQARGFVTSRIVKAPSEEGGRRRRCYRLAPAGALALERSYRDLTAMARGLHADLSAAARAADGERS